MRTNLGSVIVLALFLSARSTALAAHHSFAAEFDANKPFTMTGTVTKVEWMNPHAYVYVDVRNPKTGKLENWGIEMGSPSGLMRAGWMRDTLKLGDVVTVEGNLARDGTRNGNARSVTLNATGQRLFAASSQGQTGQ